MYFNWVKVGMYAPTLVVVTIYLLLLLLLLHICACESEWLSWVESATDSCLRQVLKLFQCVWCVRMCVYESLKSGSHKQNQRRANNQCSHTHTHAYIADTLTHTNVNSRRLTAFGGVRAAPWLCWLYSPARNDRNVLKWDNCCFDWLHYYCCCLIFFLFAFLLFAKNHLCLYVDFFFVYIYFFLLLLIIFFVHFYISCIYGMHLCVCGYIFFFLAHTNTHFCIIWSTQSSSTRIIVNF